MEHVYRLSNTAWAAKMAAHLKHDARLQDVALQAQDGGFQVMVNVDRSKAGRLGVSMQTVNDTLNDAFGQRQISTIYGQANQYRVVIEAKPEYQRDPSALSKLFLPSSTSGAATTAVAQIPLGAVATHEPEIRECPLQPDQARPDLVGLQASQPQRYPGLFLSNGDAGWDVLFAFPQDFVRISAADGLHGLQSHPALQLQPASSSSSDLPFSGGWLCAFSYELGGLFEPRAGPVEDDAGFPLAWLVRIPAAILFDRANGRCVLMAEAGQASLLDHMERDLAELPPPLPVVAELEASALEAAEGVRVEAVYGLEVGDDSSRYLNRGCTNWPAQAAGTRS